MNIASYLYDWSLKTPEQTAISFPHLRKDGRFQYKSLSFRELEKRSQALAHGFRAMGIPKGAKVLMFIRPSLNFSALTFALFKLGLVPTFIDPGMGRKNLLASIKQIKPDVLLAESEVHFARLVFSHSFKGIKWFITNGKFSWGKMKKVNDLLKSKGDKTILEEMGKEDAAAILFTSGGTGSPKGVLYTHSIFDAQINMLRDLFQLTPKDIDVPGFPLFSLFTIAMGMKSSIPSMDPSRPSNANPVFLYQNIQDNQATFVAGSPAIWERLADYCLENKLKLPSIKYLVMFGAPVSIELHQKFSHILPQGTTYTPYGATECLPVATASGSLILSEKIKTKMEKGMGTFLGSPGPNVQLKIIGITENPIKNLDQAQVLEPYKMGEILVHSQTVTPQYVGLPDQTALAKIHDKEGKIWHRMGDIGYLDDSGNLWFGGRKSHRVVLENQELLSSVQCESIFNKHPEIKRSALISYKRNKQDRSLAAIVIERKDGKVPTGKNKITLDKELMILAKESQHTSKIEKIFYKSKFPVDIRHNIKIDRLKLAKEAQSGHLD